MMGVALTACLGVMLRRLRDYDAWQCLGKCCELYIRWGHYHCLFAILTAGDSGSWAGNIELHWRILQRSQSLGTLALVTLVACVSLVSLLGSAGGWQSDGEAVGGWPQAWLSEWRMALLCCSLRALRFFTASRGTVAFEFLLCSMWRNFWIYFLLDSVGGWVNKPFSFLTRPVSTLCSEVR